MANWGAFSEGFNSVFIPGFQGVMQNNNAKKTKEEELRDKLLLLEYQSNLENQSLTPIEKQMQRFGYELSPKGFDQYNQATNPFRLQELKLQQMEQSMKVPYYKALTSSALQPKSELGQQLTDLMKAGLTQEQALQMIEKLKKQTFNPFGFGGAPTPGGMNLDK